jgi:diacylglycerol kinase
MQRGRRPTQHDGRAEQAIGAIVRELASRSRSLRCACRGVCDVLRSQRNAWIHAAATAAVVVAGACFGLTRLEWALLTLAMSAVWTAETFNTALEALGDAVAGEHHALVGRAKDVAAGAVLVSATGALVVGALVFGPRILDLIGRR